ncbi:MAG: hypothetical protein HC934_03765 [Acaryochloridaceae cyanobacterium SU_2_1]|nr:hypothetical protein [Acaryochloridaceae cyanobacterium SU_2_1]
MDCRVRLTNRDINHLIATLYLQTHLEDETALALIDQLNNELDFCLAEHRGIEVRRTEDFLAVRRQLARQLYFRSRSHNGDA